MFVALLDDVSLWQPILTQQVLRESLAWLQQNASNANFGDYPLGEPGWYANVHGYETLPEAECCWENHRQTIDIQYLIDGCEGVRWTNSDQLGLPSRYLKDRDREEFATSLDTSSLITMLPGRFVIFMPGDAHCPKILMSAPQMLRKVVVKIPSRLVFES